MSIALDVYMHMMYLQDQNQPHMGIISTVTSQTIVSWESEPL